MSSFTFGCSKYMNMVYEHVNDSDHDKYIERSHMKEFVGELPRCECIKSFWLYLRLHQLLQFESGVEIDVHFGDSEGSKENSSKKRGRTESCGPSSTKACREKLRRDKLNDKFMELCSILDPGRPPKTDKAAILIDAVRMVIQLRNDAQKLKDSNSNLLDKIKELKVEKTELEQQRLKAEKDKLEQQLKNVNTPHPSFMAPPPRSLLHLVLQLKPQVASWCHVAIHATCFS